MPVISKTPSRPVGQLQRGSNVARHVPNAKSAGSGRRRSSPFVQLAGSTRLLATRVLNFLAPGNLRANSKCIASERAAQREVAGLLDSLATLPGKQDTVRDRLDVHRVLVDLEGTMRPMTSRGRKYDTVLERAVERKAARMPTEELDIVMARLDAINAQPSKNARISIIQAKLIEARAKHPDLPTI